MIDLMGFTHQSRNRKRFEYRPTKYIGLSYEKRTRDQFETGKNRIDNVWLRYITSLIFSKILNLFKLQRSTSTWETYWTKHYPLTQILILK